MKATLEIRSRSRANDISLIALSDLSAAANSAGLRHRVIGGQMVDPLLHYTGTYGQVIDRATADADVGVARTAITANQIRAFADALADRDYGQMAGERRRLHVRTDVSNSEQRSPTVPSCAGITDPPQIPWDLCPQLSWLHHW